MQLPPPMESFLRQYQEQNIGVFRAQAEVEEWLKKIGIMSRLLFGNSYAIGANSAFCEGKAHTKSNSNN